MIKSNEKKMKILDAMEQLMDQEHAQSISVSDIARKAGMGKGSIYYYFKSKEEILEAVIERAYSGVVEKSKILLLTHDMDALTKMQVIYRTCLDSSTELLRQETNNFFEVQQSALLHQQFISIMIKNLRPILADIIRQGNAEGSICCKSPEEVSELVLIILTVKLDNHITKDTGDQIKKTLNVFTYMLETSFHIQKGRLNYLLED